MPAAGVRRARPPNWSSEPPAEPGQARDRQPPYPQRGGADLTEGGPAYGDQRRPRAAADDAIESAARPTDPLGDSLVVVGGEGLWNVHVHVGDVGAAGGGAGIEAGRPHRIRVTHFTEQVAAARQKVARRPQGSRRGDRGEQGPGWPACSPRQARSWCRAGQGSGRRPA
ncbi:MAG: hypothetical protein U0R78_09885 [Nocardioidaceae bacterium]